VQRQVQLDVVTERRESLRKTARHVSEAADLGVRGGLGGRKNDLHEPPDVNEM
jgi:hypothetical protein